ncbi:MAG: hypothetical protein AAF266_16745, partial [Planctomycetota bacterium]
MLGRSHPLRLLLVACITVQTLIPASARADHLFGRLKRFVGESTYHGTEPKSCSVNSIEQLAEHIDWMEHHIDTYGSVVAKQPDIWGEARLTKHRDEYERILFRELNQFKSTINASISQGDGAFLAQALALSNAATGATSTPAQVPEGAVTIDVANAQLRGVESPAATTFQRFGITDPDNPTEPGIKLEPTTYLDQMSRYLQHLHELRRVNEGDDTSDSPGYALNLVRMPVSILPGKLTREGFGAEITVTATPVISDDLLPTTFTKLVINDAVQQLRLPLTREVERLLTESPDESSESDAGAGEASSEQTKNPSLSLRSVDATPPTGSAGGNAAIALTMITDIYGKAELKAVATHFQEHYYGRNVRWNGCPDCENGTQECRVNLLDVQAWLRPATQAAHRLLS